MSPQNFHVEAIIPNVMAFGDRVLGFQFDLTITSIVFVTLGQSLYLSGPQVFYL